MFIFGLTLAGKIKTLAEQTIKTRFFHVFWLPIIPLGSMFIVNDDDEDSRRINIKWNLLSTLLAYSRRYLGLGWMMALLVFFMEGMNWNDLITAGICFVPWAVSMFVLGRVGSDEKYERILLGMGTGVFAYPEWFPKKTVQEMLSGLEDRWNRAHEGRDWRGAASSKTADKKYIPLLYSLARYDAVLDKSEMNRQRNKELLSWAEQVYPRETYLEKDFFPDAE